MKTLSHCTLGVDYNLHCWNEDPLTLYPVHGRNAELQSLKYDKNSLIINDGTSYRTCQTIFTGGCLTRDQILIGIVTAVIVTITEQTTLHADISGCTFVAARSARHHWTVQFVREVAVSAVISLVAHL